ncbi:hypothetical protein PRZ48_008912 [Zasmidium cellare]|uniref:RING-type domain-containing protein n=1 Tax=Zasmidium cellare TaxID=395010 RepID=A0ABR0EGT6_ZASCE|nr:hypothetical protein PRZ48_008912 [Zasmidium cellare]
MPPPDEDWTDLIHRAQVSARHGGVTRDRTDVPAISPPATTEPDHVSPTSPVIPFQNSPSSPILVAQAVMVGGIIFRRSDAIPPPDPSSPPFTFTPLVQPSAEPVFPPRSMQDDAHGEHPSVDVDLELAETIAEIRGNADKDPKAKLKLDQIDNGRCAACKEGYTKPMISTTCAHVLCKGCVVPFVQEEGKCPVCLEAQSLAELAEIETEATSPWSA